MQYDEPHGKNDGRLVSVMYFLVMDTFKKIESRQVQIRCAQTSEITFLFICFIFFRYICMCVVQFPIDHWYFEKLYEIFITTSQHEFLDTDVKFYH